MKLAQHKLSRRMKFRGLDISIETDEGEVRRWHDASTGEEGKTKMSIPYGYIRRTEGVDGDHVDVFVGPREDAENVYVIHQRKAPDFKTFDEDKCMLGFHTADEAKAAYKNHYNDDRFFGSMSVLPFEKFKAKVLATFESPRKIAMPLPPDMPSPLPSMEPLQNANRALREAYQAAGVRHALLAAGIPLAAMGLSAGIGHRAAGGRARPDTSPALRGMGGGAVGGAAGLGAGAGLSSLLRRFAPDALGMRRGVMGALGLGGLAAGAYLGGRSTRRADGAKEAVQQLGLKTSMARPKTLSESVHEADAISRQLRSFARRTPDLPGTESSHNLASKTLDDLPAKAAAAAIYEHQCKRAAERLKQAWWPFGNKAQTPAPKPYAAHNALYPNSKITDEGWARAGRIEQASRTAAPPPPPPPPVAVAQKPEPKMTASRAGFTNWDQAGR